MLGRVFLLEGWFGLPLEPFRPWGLHSGLSGLAKVYGLAGKLSAGFWLRSGLSVTSILHGHKRFYDTFAIVTWSPAKTLSTTGLRLLLLLLFFN